MLSDRLVNIFNTINDEISRMLLIDLGRLTATGAKDNIRKTRIRSKAKVVGISSIDISEEYQALDATVSGKKTEFKIGNLIKFLYGDIIEEKKVTRFSYRYEMLRKKVFRPTGEEITESEIKYDPKNNIRSTFLSLVTETYPHGHEDEVASLINGLTKDKYGNYYKIVGKSETMFTSHFDTVSREKVNIGLRKMIKDGDEFIFTDGNSILGADDKAGVVVMLYMIEHNIPGIYYFFQGEERGGIGSGLLSSEYDIFPHLKGIKRCISFDRRNYHSVITNQLGRVCCSEQFANALCSQLNKNGLQVAIDPTGIYTDSASLMDDIPECTNISVGYFNEHTEDECQNMNFLEKLCKACIKVDWESLPINRRVGFTEEIKKKYGGLISDLKKTLFYNEVKMMGEDGQAFLRIEIDAFSLNDVHFDFAAISNIFNKYKLDPDMTFQGNKIKMIIK